MIFILAGCFKQPSQGTKTTLVIQSNISVAQLTGGVMIWGVGPNNTFMALALNDETQKKEIELASGSWYFFSVGWMGASKLTGAQKCASATTTLIKDTATVVNFNMTTAHCGGSDFAPAAHLSSNQFLPLRFISCNNTSSFSGGANCSTVALKGSVRSYRIVMPQFNSSFEATAPQAGLVSACVSDGGGSNSIATSSFTIPVGKTGLWPMHTLLETFDNTGCTGIKKNFPFINGLKNTIADTQIFSSGGYTEVFTRTLPTPPASIAYPSSININRLVAITAINPSITGGLPTSWTATGLPSGLAINSTLGQITGTTSASTGTYSVIVNASNAAGNVTNTFSIVVNPEPAPTSTTIAINASEYTNLNSVTLNLSAIGATEMYITNSAGCGAGGSWESYATTKTSWTLGQLNNIATVYVKYRNSSLIESSCISDTITHDNTAPTSTSVAIAAGAAYTNSTSVTLNLIATGATQMYITNTAACSAGGIWETYANAKVWALGQTNASATVYVKYRDDASNESACVSDSITHDSIPPASTSIAINSASAFTNSTSVTLNLSAVGASEMYITNTSACGGGGVWESYSVTKAWTLGQVNALATVFVKFRDQAGNVTSCISDTITHDNTAPIISSINMPANGTYSVGNPLSFTVNFSENVTVTGGTPRLVLSFISGTVFANLSSGSGTSALIFTYNVLVTDSSSPSIAIVSLDLNGATIRDSATNNANQSFTSPANTIVVYNGAILVWQNGSGSTITSYDFGTPGANSNVTLYVKNTGTSTSGTVAVSITVNPSLKLSLGTNNCTVTLAPNASCTVQIQWIHKSPLGLTTGTVNASASPGTSANLTVLGTR